MPEAPPAPGAASRHRMPRLGAEPPLGSDAPIGAGVARSGVPGTRLARCSGQALPTDPRWRVAADGCPPSWVWYLCSAPGLIGCTHGTEHIFGQAPDQPAAPPGRPGRPLAGRTRRRGCPRGRRGRPRRPGPSTAGRLRNRLHLSHDTASGWVRTAQALTDGAVSRAHGAVVAAGTHDPPPSPRSTRSRCWWRRLGGWTHPGCAGSLATSSRPPTPKPPRPTWSASTSGGACG